MSRSGFALAVSALVCSLASSSGVDATVRTASSAVLTGKGIGGVTFGEPATRATSALQHLIGRAPHALESDRGDSHCGYDASLAWPDVTAWFDLGRFVGYQVTGDKEGTVGLATTKGLRVGASLATARHLYGSSLTSSSTQGGAVFISTSAGRIDGFLSANPIYDAASAKITTIGAGIEGCPAMEP